MAEGGELSKLGILVAQLESIVNAAVQKPPEPLICFDLLYDLLKTLEEESKVICILMNPFWEETEEGSVRKQDQSLSCLDHVPLRSLPTSEPQLDPPLLKTGRNLLNVDVIDTETISPTICLLLVEGSLLLCQRKGEDALQALLLLGVRPPVRRLASTAMTRFIERGDSISIYSRASSLQGWLSDKADVRKSEPASCIGAAQCLGSLYWVFGQRITSGLLETTSIVAKLMKSSEVKVRQAALQLLQDALEGSGGGGSLAAYTEAVRIILKFGASDKSAVVRATAAGCLRAAAVTGGPGVGYSGLEACITLCLKALEDSAQPVRDGFAAALGALLALGLNPQAQAQPKGRAPPPLPAKPLEGALQKHLIIPFLRASGPRCKDVRVGLTMASVAFLQGMHLAYGHDDLELSNLGMQALSMLTSSPDAHAQACVLYILRVGVVEQMGEPAQKEFTVLLTKQLSAPNNSSPVLIVILRTLTHLLITLGEVSLACREALDDSLVETLSNSSMAVRVEAALTLRSLAEVDPTCANNLLSCGVTTLRALQETVAVEKGERLRLELDSLHGQAAMLAALLAVCPKLPLGVPSRLPSAVLEVAKRMVFQPSRNYMSAAAEKEAGWMLIGALVSSMPKQELEEQELEIIALWTIEFGGNYREHLKEAEKNLSATLSGWSAAMEALAAFVQNYVVPNTSSIDEGILLQPILGYLTGALKYLASSTLQQSPQSLKPALDLFTIRTLRAFQALPDPFVYKNDHVELLAICSLPFREPEKYGASSCLRGLLDHSDASLGPWVPGRDIFEDELRAFEGGADGLLPCVWDGEVPSFSQPLSLSTLLVDAMLLTFGNVFASQSERNKLQLLELMTTKSTGKKQGWRFAFTTNVCVALLGGLKASIGMRSQGAEGEALKQVHEILQGILAEEGTASAERRAAAEGLGVLARLGSDVYAARLTRSLLTNAIGAQSATQRGSLALALGCIHRSVGGIALSALVPATVQALCSLAKDPTEALHIWSLHGLWLTAEAAGLSYVPHVQATLSLVMDLLLSDDYAAPELGQSIGRLINAIVAVLGPELAPGSSFYSRCKSVVSEISTKEEPAALLECVMFTQQLALFAPQAVSVHLHVQTLRPTLSSRQPSLREAAVATLRHLSERDPVSLVVERIEEDLFAMLDNETDERIIRSVRLTLQRLLEAACPSFSSRWLHLCRNVVLATSTTKTAGGGYHGVELGTGIPTEAGNNEEHAMGEDDEGMIIGSGIGAPSGEVETKGKEADHLPRYKTRLFAAECLSRLPVAVGSNPMHFDLVRAKEVEGGDWLVLHLGELVALAYQVATGSLESLRPMGVELLDTILDKFGKTEDPEYNGHLLLEQYQAQLMSAVRTALEPSAGPLLMAAGSRLAARIVTSGVAGGDRGVLQRVVTLISRPLGRWEDLRIPAYAEWVGCKVQVSLLGAHAAVKTYAFACSKEGSPNSSDGLVLLPLLAPHSSLLGPCWIGLLRDFTAIRTQWATKMQPRYEPFLEGVQLAAIAAVVHPYLSEAWPVVLEAVTLDAVPASTGEPKEKENTKSGTGKGLEINAVEFKQIWGLAILMLSGEEPKGLDSKRSITSFPSFNGRLLSTGPAFNYQLVALRALRCLCAKGFYKPDMLSIDLCQELLQILLDPRFQKYSGSAAAIVYLVEQIINASTEEYMEKKDLVLKAAELCLGCIHRLQGCDLTTPRSTSEIDGVVCSALRAMATLVGRLNPAFQALLLPQLLSAGIKILNEAPVNRSAPSAAVGFITALTLVTAKYPDAASSSNNFGPIQRALMLASAVESLAQLFEGYVSETSQSDEQVLMQRLPLVLGVMVAMARSLPEVASPKQAAQARCVSCLHSALLNTHTSVQMAGLQTLRTVAQAGSTEQPRGESYAWALLLLRRLAGDVTSIMYKCTKASMTEVAAGAVGEGLKLLVLLHSLVEGEESQLEVLHVLLPAIISAASVRAQDNQVAAALVNAAVKLVTHLASVPSSAAQFRTVLLDLPPESRQQLQAIIRASVSQHNTASSGLVIATIPVDPRPTSRPVLPTSSAGFLLPPPSSGHLAGRPAAATTQPSPDFDDEDDDEWDDFQAHPAIGDSSSQPASFVEKEVDDIQASPPIATSTGLKGAVDAEERGRSQFTPFESTANAPQQGAIEEWGDAFASADSLCETPHGLGVKDEKWEQESQFSSALSNSTAFASESRVPETSQPGADEEVWDSLESAPMAVNPSMGTSPSSFDDDEDDDDDIWDSSLEPGDIYTKGRGNGPQEHSHAKAHEGQASLRNGRDEHTPENSSANGKELMSHRPEDGVLYDQSDVAAGGLETADLDGDDSDDFQEAHSEMGMEENGHMAETGICDEYISPGEGEKHDNTSPNRRRACGGFWRRCGCPCCLSDPVDGREAESR